MKRTNTRGLGKGFGSLLPDEFDNSILIDKKDRIQKVSIADISPDPDQPRKHFEKNSLEELASSIKTYGILQPLVVRPDGARFIIIAGERRYRAGSIAGLKTVPVLVRSSQELERLEIGLIENVQRVDLSPLEQAVSIAKLSEQFNLSYEAIAKRLGKAQTTIINIVRLLKLPDSAKEALIDKKITEGHARAILSLSGDEFSQKKLLRGIIKDKLSVRQAELFVQKNKSKKQPLSGASSEQKIDKDSSALLSAYLKTLVSVKTGKNSGKIQISYKSNKELNRIIKLLIKK